MSAGIVTDVLSYWVAIFHWNLYTWWHSQPCNWWKKIKKLIQSEFSSNVFLYLFIPLLYFIVHDTFLGTFHRLVGKKKNFQLHYVCMCTWSSSAPTGQTSMKFGSWGLKHCQKNCSLIKIYQKIMGSLHEALSKFMIIFHWILLRLINVIGKNCREDQNPHFVLNKFSLKIMWKNMMGPDRLLMLI